MTEYSPISSAPSNRPVLVSLSTNPEFGEHLMERSGRRWVGRDYTVMGSRRVYWDAENFPGPDRWREPLTA